VLVILAIAAIAILACVVMVSLGKGGELTEFPPDVPPLDLPEPGQLTAVDFMALQLPVNLVGYHTASVDETLRRAASAISARDTRIAVLEQRVSELLASRLHARQEVYAAPGTGPRTDHAPEAPVVARELPESGDPVSAGGATMEWNGNVEPPHPPEWRLPNGTSGQEDAPADHARAAEAAETADAGEAAETPTETADAREAADGRERHEHDGEPVETAEAAEPGAETGASAGDGPRQ
jgi:hypothetical protein